MNESSPERTVITTDVLVLGAGGAGMCAALKASESGADVLMVDKCGIGYNGQVPIGGGILAYVYPDEVDTLGREGHPRQQLLQQPGVDLRVRQPHAPDHHDLADMGLTFLKKDGEIDDPRLGTDQRHPLRRAQVAGGLKRTARARGVKMMDKIFVIDLLKNGDQVVGAVGFGLVDGRVYEFNAKATIVATGNCGYLHEKTYASVLGRGAGHGLPGRGADHQRRVQQHVRVGYQAPRQGAHGHPLLPVSGERPGREDHGQVLPGADGGRARRSTPSIPGSSAPCTRRSRPAGGRSTSTSTG